MCYFCVLGGNNQYLNKNHFFFSKILDYKERIKWLIINYLRESAMINTKTQQKKQITQYNFLNLKAQQYSKNV